MDSDDIGAMMAWLICMLLYDLLFRRFIMRFGSNKRSHQTSERVVLFQREFGQEMSLVDYASSSDDDVSDSEQEPQQQHHEPPPAPQPQRLHYPPKTLESGPSADRKPEYLEKLPDASMLLNSPDVPLTSGNDHASMVAAAMADNMSRKRDSKGMMGSGSRNSAPPLPRAKLPRATLPYPKNVPDTGGGILVPPQLRGRSNVVTEDISKLFVSRHAAAQPRGPENEE